MGDPGEQGAEVEGLAPPLRRIPIEDAFSGLLGVVREVGTAARTHWPGLLDRPIRALFNLGVRLEQGVDGTADFDRMTAYYRRAAEQGFGPAQLRLAQADLEQGRAADAWFWFSVAGQTLTAEEDQAQARAGCDAAYHQMTLAEIEAARHRLRDWSIAP